MSTTVKSSRKQTVAELPDSPECLGGNLAWLLGQAHYAILSEVSAAFAPLGISSRGYHVLAAALTAEHTQSELAVLVGVDKTTMVVTVDELEAAGLAERRPSETDRRARVIVVTEAGESKVTEGREVIKAIQAAVLGRCRRASARSSSTRSPASSASASPSRSSAHRRCGGAAQVAVAALTKGRAATAARRSSRTAAGGGSSRCIRARSSRTR